MPEIRGKNRAPETDFDGRSCSACRNRGPGTVGRNARQAGRVFRAGRRTARTWAMASWLAANSNYLSSLLFRQSFTENISRKPFFSRSAFGGLYHQNNGPPTTWIWFFSVSTTSRVIQARRLDHHPQAAGAWSFSSREQADLRHRAAESGSRSIRARAFLRAHAGRRFQTRQFRRGAADFQPARDDGRCPGRDSILIPSFFGSAGTHWGESQTAGVIKRAG